jgi:broad specificity phosphatase PhoE
VVYLVRHAHAGRKSEWNGPDLARPLSTEGRRQAVGLVGRLDAYPVRRILSSPAERCLQTVAPLARRRGFAIEPSDALGVDGSGAAVLELMANGALHDAVLCTHGEVIGQLFEELRGVGVELSKRPTWAKVSTWVLDLDGTRIWKGSYLHPLSVEPAAQDPLLR